jgi:uncharacterized membrane protein YeaQ/YmgE (transglycosylase-associated protein family)
LAHHYRAAVRSTTQRTGRGGFCDGAAALIIVARAGARGAAQPWEAAMFSLDRIVVWIIIGLIGGSLAGLIIKRERRGFGMVRNLALGLVGALVGGLLFRLLQLLPGLDRVTISLRDVVAAVVGSLIVLGLLWLWQRWRRAR